MKIFDRLREGIGLGSTRSLPPPAPVAISDGVLVLDRKAEAWFTIATSNTDLADEDSRDLALDQIIATAEKVLKDRDCHLKIVWGRISGDAYAEEAEAFASAPGGAAWVATRAQRIDELGLPSRHILLGVHLADREVTVPGVLAARAGDALGTGNRRVSKKELTHLDTQMRRIARILAHSEWKARPASAETIAWMIGREQHRVASAVPREGTITGASLARLTQGRVVPYTDHLRIYDGKGRVTAAVAALALTVFPEEMEIPGEGEWLRTLSDITRITDDGEEVAVIAEASVRFRLLSRPEARKAVDKVRQSAKEQRRHAAKTSAETTSEETEETEARMSEIKAEIGRNGLTLVHDHPYILVTEPDPEDLEASVDAVVSHYGSLGITAEVAFDEQRDAWLQAMPGDYVRIPDLGHTRTAVSLFGSWWWGGSFVGDLTGPVIGAMTGSTPGLVRNDSAAGSQRGDATTTFFCGRSGRGKTTAMMLSLLDVTAAGGWSAMLDFKEDCGGVVEVARAYGMPSGLIRAGSDFSGAADLFRLIPDPSAAVLHVVRLLLLLAPKHLKAEAETAIMDAAQRVSLTPDPTTWAVIQDLASSGDSAGEPNYQRRLGEALRGLASTPLGSTVAGPAVGTGRLHTEPGLWVMQMPGLNLPKSSTAANPDDWDPSQRVSMACLRGFIAWSIFMAGSGEVRGLSKTVAIPEVHLVTATADGASFLEDMARMGRALFVNLLFDSQDPETITDMAGLVEQITTVFAFEQISRPQQEAIGALLHLIPNGRNRQLIGSINRQPDGEIRHGHCIMRDWRNNVATIEWDIPSEEVRRLLSTTPDANPIATDLDDSELMPV